MKGSLERTIERCYQTYYLYCTQTSPGRVEAVVHYDEGRGILNFEVKADDCPDATAVGWLEASSEGTLVEFVRVDGSIFHIEKDCLSSFAKFAFLRAQKRLVPRSSRGTGISCAEFIEHYYDFVMQDYKAGLFSELLELRRFAALVVKAGGIYEKR